MGTRSHHKSHRWFDKSATLRKAAKYIHERKIAAVKAEQVRERSGPASMEWMQSALFLYAARKEGMQDDLKKALWAYTSAMIHKLELILTDAEHLAKSKDIEDTYRWCATQLRVAITRHLKLLEWAEGDILVPRADNISHHIQGTVHKPTATQANDAITYMVGEYKMANPDAAGILPKKDSEIDALTPKNYIEKEEP